jgi:hypothetical protein
MSHGDYSWDCNSCHHSSWLHVCLYDEALDVIKKLHGGAPGQDDDFYIREFNQIKAQHELEVRERVGLMTVLRRPSYRKRMLIVVFQFAFAMFTGQFIHFSLHLMRFGWGRQTIGSYILPLRFNLGQV